ncbi:MAG: type IV toxin-antitoxin system AbiEi family antitoxin domain-containing protein [Planctomycetes bacterium]|nr:type IV toxin-antitoxin system AbiEi family antitoxin domain-containing protein [Planctomycetota bacterium]
MDAARKILTLVRKLGVLRARDLDEYDLPRTHLRRLVDNGQLQVLGRGLYTLADVELSPQSNLAAVARRVPHAVICLLSALRLHDLTTQAPFQTWIAIATRARPPKLDGLPTRIVHMAPGPLAAGVVHRTIDGVRVPVFDLEKTVVDCFRYRNKIGLDVALEAMREYLRRPRRNVDRLLHYAGIDRVQAPVRPYLEAML